MSELPPKQASDFVAKDNDHLLAETSSQNPEGFIRSGRNLESYKRVFGEEFRKREELILDIGAGDATMADEIETLTDHKAKVIRIDKDYGQIPPGGEAPAVAGDATKMPFANASFDRIVCHNVLYYLGRDEGARAISEMLRTLKVGGEAAIYPAKPFVGPKDEIGHKEKPTSLNFPRLIITKPPDFEQWSEQRKQQVYEELVKNVTGGETSTKLIHWGINKAVERKGTHRTVERGSNSSL